MSEEDFTKDYRFQLILQDAIAYRVLCRTEKYRQQSDDKLCVKSADDADGQSK